VLCEKPMAINEAQCLAMIEAAHEGGVQLMVGYRLHFEPANLAAIEAVQRGDIGEARLFESTFTMQVREGNSRLSAALGGGPLYDIGIYCINAARYLFRDEPIEVTALAGRHPNDDRFRDVDEHCAGVLRFRSDRLALFSASLGAAESARYDVIGTKGHLRVEPAYHHSGAMDLIVQSGEQRKRRKFKGSDQVASEIIYFSSCVLEGRRPEPSGIEGLADVRVIRALLTSAESGRAVEIEPIEKHDRPDDRQRIFVPGHATPSLVHAQPPTR
jgi:glucose-fructose oxidoreductase